MVNRKDRGNSAVHKTAEALRKLAIDAGSHTLLGSEDDLIEQFGVCRPTLRQAAALVAQEQLLYVRRGVKGGYFASLPDSSAVARMASIYLRARGADMMEVVHAIAPVRVEVARLATRSRNSAMQAELRDFLEREHACPSDEEIDYRGFLRDERAFGDLLSRLAENSVFSLFLGILYDLVGQVARGADVYVHHQERIDSYRRQRNLMAAAILEGDEEMAVLATRRCSAIVTEWMLDDLHHAGRTAVAEGRPVDMALSTPS